MNENYVGVLLCSQVNFANGIVQKMIVLQNGKKPGCLYKVDYTELELILT
ncbi:hypothetical protein [Paenibacillus larvae]|nr:hypothetical protein [Paenibacillus larvae]